MGTSFRTNEKAKLLRAFWILLCNTRMQGRAEEIQSLQEQLKQAKEQKPTSESRGYYAGPCRACHAWSVLSSELNQASELSITLSYQLMRAVTISIACLTRKQTCPFRALSCSRDTASVLQWRQTATVCINSYMCAFALRLGCHGDTV